MGLISSDSWSCQAWQLRIMIWGSRQLMLMESTINTTVCHRILGSHVGPSVQQIKLTWHMLCDTTVTWRTPAGLHQNGHTLTQSESFDVNAQIKSMNWNKVWTDHNSLTARHLKAAAQESGRSNLISADHVYSKVRREAGLCYSEYFLRT